MLQISNKDHTDRPFGDYFPPDIIDNVMSVLRNSGLMRGQFRKFIANWIKRNHNGPWDVSIRAYRARIFLHDNSCELKAYLAGDVYCKEEFKLMGERMANKVNPVFVDIGANAGLFTLHANSVTQDGAKILSIEPNPILVSRLEFNISANNANDKCTVYPFALGEVEGIAEFAYSNDMGSGSLVTSSIKNGATFTANIVPLVKLIEDENITKIDFLKIDIEGHEDKVMPHFFSTAPESLYPDCVIIENNIDEWDIDCVSQMTELGYEIIFANKANIALEYKPGAKIH